MKNTTIKTDFIVIGSGIAGLTAALKLAKAGKVTLLTKKKLDDSATNLAQGGIAAALKEDDKTSFHYRDTLRVGVGLCKAKAVKILVEEGAERVKELIARGVKFDKYRDNLISFTKEGGHSKRRILHSGDSTGEAIESILIKEVKSNKNIKIYESIPVLELLTKNKVCYGVLAESKGPVLFLGKAVFIATGGVAHLYLQSTHPFVCTGDGIAMAYRAGAVIENMEFIQFHPTTLYARKTWRKEPLFLISEAVRGEGAILRNTYGESFMHKYHPQGDLAPRDVVSRAIVNEMQKTLEDRVFLDFTQVKEDLPKRFPNIYKKCKEEGYDISKGYLPVAPATHYLMGGIKTDVFGRTNIKGLYAIGEAASTGVHGANRLASNSLLEGLVFGTRAAERAIANGESKDLPDMQELDSLAKKLYLIEKPDPARDEKMRTKIQKIMWFKVGIIRNGKDLKEASRKLNEISENGLTRETRNLLLMAKIITRSALKRKESRGAHYRLDHPHRNVFWRRPSAVSR